MVHAMAILLVVCGLQLIGNWEPQPTVPHCVAYWYCSAGDLYLILVFFYRDFFRLFCARGLDFREMSLCGNIIIVFFTELVGPPSPFLRRLFCSRRFLGMAGLYLLVLRIDRFTRSLE